MGGVPGSAVDGESIDADRFRSLYERHARALSAYCARRVSTDQVDDAVAETFLVAWRRIDDVPDGADGLLWLYAVAHRVVGREWRGSSRRHRLIRRLGSLGRVGADGPEDAVVADDDAHRVLDAVSRLGPGDAEMLRLVAWERLSPADIATVLEIKPNAVHQRLHRARRNLVSEFERLDGSLETLPASRGEGSL